MLLPFDILIRTEFASVVAFSFSLIFLGRNFIFQKIKNYKFLLRI
jgi:hypothetical protein